LHDLLNRKTAIFQNMLYYGRQTFVSVFLA